MRYINKKRTLRKEEFFFYNLISMLPPILGLTDCSIILVIISPLASTESRDFFNMEISMAFIELVPDKDMLVLPREVIFI